MAVKVGFTGSSEIITEKQCKVLVQLLTAINNDKGISQFHHGDCIKSDAEAHKLVRMYFKSARIFLHPPTKHIKRAFCVGDETYPEKNYLARNKHMVNKIDILFATPKQEKDVIRSGTWSTIRYAQKVNKIIYIILPDGRYEIKESIQNGC